MGAELLVLSENYQPLQSRFEGVRQACCVKLPWKCISQRLDASNRLVSHFLSAVFRGYGVM